MLDRVLLVTTFTTKEAVQDLEAFFKFPCSLKQRILSKSANQPKYC